VGVADADGRVRPRLGPREAKGRFGRGAARLRRPEVGPVRERVGDQPIDVGGRRRHGERPARLDVVGVAADEGQERVGGLAPRADGLRQLALEAALLERDPVVLRARDVTAPGPLRGHADGLAVAREVLAREAQPFARELQADEAAADLEGGEAFDVAAARLGRSERIRRLLDARGPLAPQLQLFAETALDDDRIARAEAARLRLTQCQILDADREGGIRKRAGGPEIALRATDLQCGDDGVRVSGSHLRQRFLEREADRGSVGDADAQREHERRHATNSDGTPGEGAGRPGEHATWTPQRRSIFSRAAIGARHDRDAVATTRGAPARPRLNGRGTSPRRPSADARPLGSAAARSAPAQIRR
jgi:hypothetical protein